MERYFIILLISFHRALFADQETKRVCLAADFSVLPRRERGRKIRLVVNFKSYAVPLLFAFPRRALWNGKSRKRLVQPLFVSLYPCPHPPFHLYGGQRELQATRQHGEVQLFTCFPFLLVSSCFGSFFQFFSLRHHLKVLTHRFTAAFPQPLQALIS